MGAGMVRSRGGRLPETLPLDQRAQRYREFAEQALRRASDTHDPEMRAGFLSMAAGWHALAEEIVRTMARAAAGEETGPNPAQRDPH